MQSLKEELLELLEKDKEFRHAVAGLIGYKEVLERITSLEERVISLEERIVSLEERIVSLEEGQQKLEERIISLEERIASLEEGQQRIEGRITSLEERIVSLEERAISLEERMVSLEEGQRELKRMVSVIAHRFGVISENAFREGMRAVLEEELEVAEVGRFIIEDEEGLVYGHPSTVEVDVLVKDGRHILVEVKSRVSKGDVAELHRIGELYAKKIGVKPSLLIVGGLVDEGARELAEKLGVRVRPVIG